MSDTGNNRADPGEIFDRISGKMIGGIARIRLGPGVIGNTSVVMISAIVVAGFVAWAFRSNPPLALGAMGLIIAGALLFVWGSWKFAHKQPDLALIGGAELLQLRRIQMAGKDAPNIPLLPPVEAPPTPVIESRPGDTNGA